MLITTTGRTTSAVSHQATDRSLLVLDIARGRLLADGQRQRCLGGYCRRGLTTSATLVMIAVPLV